MNLFCIISVVLNDVDGLRRTYSSLARQSCKDFTWLIFDGESSDGSVEYIQSIDSDFRIKHVVQRDSGIYDAMNKSIDYAEGSYYLFLNAGDCLVDDDVLHDVSMFLSGSGFPDVLNTGWLYRFPSGNVVARFPRLMKEYIWHGPPACHQAIYYKSVCFDAVRYDIRFRYAGDYALMASLYMLDYRDLSFKRITAVFDTTGHSSRHPVRMIRDAIVVKREILRLSGMVIFISLLKHVFSKAMIFVLNILPIRIIR